MLPISNNHLLLTGNRWACFRSSITQREVRSNVQKQPPRTGMSPPEWTTYPMAGWLHPFVQTYGKVFQEAQNTFCALPDADTWHHKDGHVNVTLLHLFQFNQVIEISSFVLINYMYNISSAFIHVLDNG
jgi:hypothetical protein